METDTGKFGLSENHAFLFLKGGGAGDHIQGRELNLQAHNHAFMYT